MPIQKQEKKCIIIIESFRKLCPSTRAIRKYIAFVTLMPFILRFDPLFPLADYVFFYFTFSSSIHNLWRWAFYGNAFKMWIGLENKKKKHVKIDKKEK